MIAVKACAAIPYPLQGNETIKRLQNEIYKGNGKINPSSMSTSRELSHCCYILKNILLGKKASLNELNNGFSVKLDTRESSLFANLF